MARRRPRATTEWACSHLERHACISADGDPFFDELQEVYDAIGERVPDGAPRPQPEQLPDERAESEGTGLFHGVATEQFAWTRDYDVESYIRLLNTFLTPGGPLATRIAVPHAGAYRAY